MKRLIARCLTVAMVIAGPVAAWAEDVALLVGNQRYDAYPNFPNASAIFRVTPQLESAGFRVIAVRDLKSGDLAAVTGDIVRWLNQADRVVIVVAGHIARSRQDNWLLTTDADRPDTFTIGQYGLSLGALMDFAAAKPGSAVFSVATGGDDVAIGTRLNTGFRPGRIPQGVTVVEGPPARLVGYLANQLLVPGRPMSDAAKVAPDAVRVRGFVARNMAFMPGEAAAPVPPPPAPPPPVPQPNPAADLIERSFWQRARSLNTVADYQLYLDRYPNGRFAQEARQRVAALQVTPQDRARMAEEALNLTRAQRRTIQENLTLLGFDTRGIDGIFGNRTRQAVADWQESVGVQRFGYLNANQISRIENQAARRAAELQAEAERRRLAVEREDRSYWQQTGANGSEAGLRAYLQRYPDGLFSGGAEAQLREIEREQRRLARAEERDAWDQAVMAGTLASYRAYLRDYPNGRFAEEARARVASLSEPETPPAVVAAARQEEQQLGLNAFRRQLIEGQLRSLNLDPGAVDGNFDRNTRRALRRFQRASNLAVTGYVTRNTIVRLLASAVAQ